MQTRWRIQLLGGLGADSEAQRLTHFRTRKVGLLLACLAYDLHREHRREELIERLWPEEPLETGRDGLRASLYALRRQLEPPGTPAGAVLEADRLHARLNPEAVTTDVAEFEAALRGAREAGEESEQARHLARAVELYGGELLPGYYEDWVLQERQWLAERFFQALSELLVQLERTSEFERALEYARRGVSADLLREEAHRDLIRLYAAVGQPTAALRQYHELERLLKEELGATPEPATRALVREIERLSILRSSGVQAFRRSGAHEPSPEHLKTRPGTREAGGARLDRAGENRLVTLLFADMSRSLETTRDLHPEDAAALVNRLLQAMVDVVLKYEGRIDRFQGDGVLALFGVPQAHEDDPERAIRAAMEIREAAHHLELDVTAGINTGEVYMGAVGSERHQEVTVMGPAVGLAARLQEQAEPGQILVGEVTQRLSRRAFGFGASTVSIRGLAQPVPVYRVEQALARPEKARGLEGRRAALVGREEELAKLQTALTRVLEGQGQLVTLIGEAGVGKSRLVEELRQGVGCRVWGVGSDSSDPTPYTPHPTPLWLEGRCLELNMTTGYSLFLDLLRDYFGWRAEKPEGERVARLLAALRELVDRGDLSAERAEEMGPLLGHLFSLRSGTDWDLRLKNASPEQIRHQTLLALQEFFGALARRQPVVLVLEDLHWADPLSLDLISLLMETLPQSPLLLLCVYRPEREHRCWQLAPIAARKCPEGSTELTLRELTPAQSRRLVQSLLGGEPLPAPVTERVLAEAQGNPFFVEEVIQALIEAGTLYREAGTWRVREGEAEAVVPASVQSVISSRVDRLEREVLQVLESAAVLGRLFRRRLLQAVVSSQVFRSSGVQEAPAEPLNARSGTREAGEARLNACLWELEERGLIYQERVVPEEEYSFKHVLTQETIYGSLLRRQRAALHQQAGAAIESLYANELEGQYGQLAYHYERSAADEKAVEYLLKAGEKARRAYLNEAAISYFQRTLERLEKTIGDRRPATEPAPTRSPVAGRRSSLQRLEAHRGLGQTYQDVGAVAQAETQFRQAIAVGKEIGLAPQELVRLYWWLGDALFWQGRRAEMGPNAEEGLALLGDDTESVGAALMNSQLRRDQINARFVERLPYSQELRSVYDCIIEHYCVQEKDPEQGKRWIQALERAAKQHHDLRALASSQFGVAMWVLAPGGDLKGAIVSNQRALDLLNRIGDAKHACWSMLDIGRACLELGDLQHAEVHGQRALQYAQDVGSKWDIAFSRQCIGMVALCRGAGDEATNLLGEAAQLLREIGHQGELLQVDWALARMALAREERQEALRLLQEALALIQSKGWPSEASRAFACTLSGLEEVYAHPGEFQAFCQRLREEYFTAADPPVLQWYLEPSEPPAHFQDRTHDELTAPLSSGWSWQDPLGDCSFTGEDGLEIHAANGRDLWHVNLSAPRLLQPISGELAIQTVCVPLSKDQPGIGGLLLWKDQGNYLRLERGTRGEYEISFQGCVGHDDQVIGRGRLPAGRVSLRLERRRNRVRALCSADRQSWLSVGQVAFPGEDPVQVGLHAIGAIDRTIYHGAYPEGTAIRFESFTLWR